MALRLTAPFPASLQPHELHGCTNTRRYHEALVIVYDSIDEIPGEDVVRAAYQWDDCVQAYVAIGAREERDQT